MNKIVSTIVLACFLFNTAVQDLAFGQTVNNKPNVDNLAPALTLGQDMGRIKLILGMCLEQAINEDGTVNIDKLKKSINAFQDSQRQGRIEVLDHSTFQIFENEPGYPNDYLRIMFRIRGDAHGLRTYHAFFPARKGKDALLPIYLYTDEEYKKFEKDLEKNKRLPKGQIEEPLKAKALARNVTHQAYDENVLAWVHKNKPKSIYEVPASEYQAMVNNILTTAKVNVTSGKEMLLNKKLYLVERDEEIDRQLEQYQLTIVDAQGNPHQVIGYMHTSNDAVHMFVPKWYVMSLHLPATRMEMLSYLERRLAYEVGPMLNCLPTEFLAATHGEIYHVGERSQPLPYGQIVQEITPGYKYPVNEIYKRYCAGLQLLEEPLQEKSFIAVDLDTNYETRDHAAGGTTDKLLVPVVAPSLLETHFEILKETLIKEFGWSVSGNHLYSPNHKVDGLEICINKTGQLEFGGKRELNTIFSKEGATLTTFIAFGESESRVRPNGGKWGESLIFEDFIFSGPNPYVTLGIANEDIESKGLKCQRGTIFIIARPLFIEANRYKRGTDRQYGEEFGFAPAGLEYSPVAVLATGNSLIEKLRLVTTISKHTEGWNKAAQTYFARNCNSRINYPKSLWQRVYPKNRPIILYVNGIDRGFHVENAADLARVLNLYGLDAVPESKYNVNLNYNGSLHKVHFADIATIISIITAPELETAPAGENRASAAVLAPAAAPTGQQALAQTPTGNVKGRHQEHEQAIDAAIREVSEPIVPAVAASEEAFRAVFQAAANTRAMSLVVESPKGSALTRIVTTAFLNENSASGVDIGEVREQALQALKEANPQDAAAAAVAVRDLFGTIAGSEGSIVSGLAIMLNAASSGEDYTAVKLTSKMMQTPTAASAQPAAGLTPVDIGSLGGPARDYAVAATATIGSVLQEIMKLVPSDYLSFMDYGKFAQVIKEAGCRADIVNEDGKSGFIFSTIATFGEYKEDKYEEGIGPYLPELAKKGIRIAVVTTNDRQDEFIRELNKGILLLENHIKFGRNIDQVKSELKAPRYYYLKVKHEDGVAGVVENVNIVVQYIIDAIGKMVGITEKMEKKRRDMHEAARQFAVAA